MQSKSAESPPNLRAGADFGLNLGLGEIGRICNCLKNMVGPCGLEPQTSTVSTQEYQVLTTTSKAVGDRQVLDNTQQSDTSRVDHRVEKATLPVARNSADGTTRQDHLT